MSSPGYFYTDPNQDPNQTPQQRMAMAMMGSKPGPFGGIGTAIEMKALQQRQDQNAYNQAPPISASVPFTGVNGQVQNTTVSSKLPYMGPQGLSGLFNLGGG